MGHSEVHVDRHQRLQWYPTPESLAVSRPRARYGKGDFGQVTSGVAPNLGLICQLVHRAATPILQTSELVTLTIVQIMIAQMTETGRCGLCLISNLAREYGLLRMASGAPEEDSFKLSRHRRALHGARLDSGHR